MVVPHPKVVESGADPEPLFRRHATNFLALHLLGFRVIREDSNGSVHGFKLARLDPAYRVGARQSVHASQCLHDLRHARPRNPLAPCDLRP